jgi:glycosyltransferase involved in cell wall biosynthesis
MELAESLNLSGTCAFPGWLPNLFGFYASIDINALTSINESFGLVILEGAKFALATVSSDAGGPAEIISDGFSGLLFRRQSPEELCEKLCELSENEAVRKRLGKNLYVSCKSRYSVENSVKSHEKAYCAIDTMRT